MESAASVPAPDPSGPEPGRKRSRRLLRVAPWIVALGVLSFMLARVPRADLLDALARVSVWQLVLLLFAYVPAVLVVDSLALWTALRAAVAGPSLSYGTVLRHRGASYVLGQLSYAAGQGGLVYLLWRSHKVPILATTAALILATGAFLVVMAVAVAVGLLAGAVPEREELRVIALASVAALPLYVAVIAWRPRVLARRRLLEPAFRAGVLGSAQVAAARLAHLSVLMAGHILAMRLFGIDVPLAAALAGLPVVFLVAALPISPSGLGTTQAAAITLFASFAPGNTGAARSAAVLAYSLSFQVMAAIALMLMGLLCLRGVTAARAAEPARPDI